MGKGVGSAVKEKLKKAMAESVARYAAKAGPPTPAKRGTVARAGGYAAPVDTAGMDPAMKSTLGVGKKRKK